MARKNPPGLRRSTQPVTRAMLVRHGLGFIFGVLLILEVAAYLAHH